MASTVKIKRSSVAGKVPTTSNIEAGELALNTADKVLYSTDGSSIFEIGANVDYQTVNTAIDFLGSAHGTVTAQEGRIYYDTTHKTLTAFSETGLEMELGQQEYIRVYNNTGSQINLGQPVYMTGVHTDNETPTVGLGDATDMNKYLISGLAAENIADSSFGYVAASGVVHGFNTSSLTAGERVFLGLTPGALQNASPVYPNFPMCIGYVITSDASDGEILVEMQNHTVKSFRVVTDTYLGGNLTVGGDLSILGDQSTTTLTNLQVEDTFIYLGTGDTIGEDNTTFTGTGLDDAYFTGHYNGTTSTTYYVRIDGVGTGTGGVDTFEWSTDNFSTTEATGVDITGSNQVLGNQIGILFGATTGHTSGDVWSGTAAPTNVDIGLAGNRNTGASGIGYSHVGGFYDVSDTRWKFFDRYDPEPEGNINTAHSSFWFADVQANNFIGNVTGNVTGSADSLTNGRTISITGDLSYTSGSFDGSSNVTGTGTIQTGSGTTIANYMQVANTNLLVNDRLQVANAEALYVSLSGDTMTGGLHFGDDVKATFGDSVTPDLQIYHDGSNSYIHDNGTGQLILRGSNGVILNNADNSKNLIVANDGGEVSLFHNGSQKLATTSTGIDVTGNVAASGYTSPLNAPTVGATTTLDFDNQNFTVTLDQNTTFAVSNVSTNIGKTGTIVIKQNSTGGYSFTIPTEFKTPNGDAIAQITAGDSINAINYFIVDANTILINYLGDFS